MLMRYHQQYLKTFFMCRGPPNKQAPENTHQSLRVSPRLTGYVCRNFVKYLIMLLTAVVGAAGLWKCGTSLIDCPQVHSDLGPGLLEKLGVRSARSGSQLLSWLWSFVGVNSE